MFRRPILELSSRRLIRRTPRLDASQTIPSLLSVRKEFSASFQKKNVASEAGSDKEEPKRDKYYKVLGVASLVAGALYSAYQGGHLDKYLGIEQEDSDKVGVDHEDGKKKDEMNKDISQVQVWEKVGVQSDFPQVKTEQKDETHRDVPHGEVQTDASPCEAPSETKLSNVAEKPDVAKEDGPVIVQAKHEPETSTESLISKTIEETSEGVQVTEAPTSTESLESKTIEETCEGVQVTEAPTSTESLESKPIGEKSEGVQVTEVPTQVNVVTDKNDMEVVTPHELAADDNSKAPVNSDTEAPGLLNSYHLTDSAEQSTSIGGPDEEAEDLDDSFVTKDGKLVMSFLQAIHAAEKRQAELDALAFSEEKRALREKYEKELRDARARELMHAEEAAMLDKEIKRERAKAAATIRTLQEKMEEKLKTELEQKESEAEMSTKKLQELAKAELTAAIASEKASQIEKMAEANLNINALCMAFYARSEEARQIHSVHKLALGAMALEDALSKGLPIEQELHALNTYLEGIDKDSLIHLVLSTLPEETRHSGTDTLLQLNQKFKSLKGELRHYVLIPPGGGGLLAHTMARIASWLRFKEADPSGDGIESVISRVEGFLAEGKLAEAANALQGGLKGSEAEEIAGDWVRRARNRAITEQALTVLQSYATCISLTQ